MLRLSVSMASTGSHVEVPPGRQPHGLSTESTHIWFRHGVHVGHVHSAPEA